MEASWNFGIVKFYWCCNFGRKGCIYKACIDRLDPYVINIIDNNGNATVVNPEENGESNDNDAPI